MKVFVEVSKNSNLKYEYDKKNKAEIKAKTQYDESVWPTIHQLSLETCSPDIKLAI